MSCCIAFCAETSWRRKGEKMIKGQDISTLMTINDTTSGRITVWTMVVMLILLRIIYLVAYHMLEKYRYRKLVMLKNELEFALSKQKVVFSGEVKKNEPGIHEMQSVPAEDDEDTEAMKLFESLKSKKGW